MKAHGDNEKSIWLWTTGVILIVALALIPQVDETGSDYLDGALKRALASFAIARGLNGVLSVAQGTEFAITPAGVGINLAPGEILDPLNDLVERFSWIMLLSSSALGVQKVLLSMSTWQGLSLALAAVGLLLLISLWARRRLGNGIHLVVTRLFLLLMVLRFMMPVVSLANEWVYHTFLQQQYNSASAALDSARMEIGALNDEVLVKAPSAEDLPDDNKTQGLMEKLRDLYRNTSSHLDFQKKLIDYQNAAASISEHTIGLIVVFVMQTVVFPLLFIWVLFSLMRKLIKPPGYHEH